MSNFENRARVERNASQRQLVHLIRRHGPVSRAELVGLSELGSASITNLTRDLISDGLVTEAGKQRGGKGQPAINLVLNPEAAFTVGVAPSLDSVAVAVLDFSGRPRGQHILRNSFSTFDSAIEAVQECVNVITVENGIPPAKIMEVGLALPATFGAVHNNLRPSLSINAWGETDFADKLSAAFNRPVTVENDASAATIAEMLLGNPSGYRSFVYLYLGNGIGGGVSIDGRIWRGANGNAAEFGVFFPRGSMRPSVDHLRNFLSGHGSVPGSLSDIAALYADQPALFLPWITRSRRAVCEILQTAVACFDPEGIVVGGTMPSTILQTLVTGYQDQKTKNVDMSRLIMPPVLVSNQSGEIAPAIGAASLGIS